MSLSTGRIIRAFTLTQKSIHTLTTKNKSSDWVPFVLLSALALNKSTSLVQHVLCSMLVFVSSIYVLLLRKSKKKRMKNYLSHLSLLLCLLWELLLLHVECWCHCYKRQLSYLSFSLRLVEFFFLPFFSFFEKNLFCLWRFCEKSSFEMFEIHIASASVIPFVLFPAPTHARTN